MNLLLVLPVLAPLSAAAVLYLLRRRTRLQRLLGVFTAVALFMIALILAEAVFNGGIQTTQIAGWPAPFGITLVADPLSSVMVVLSGLIGMCVAVYTLAEIGEKHLTYGFFPLFFILLSGVNGAFLTGDLFNLYVWFEVMLMASFMLMALGGGRAQLEGTVKYVSLNLIASAFFLAGVGVLYGIAGTVNMADLAQKLRAGPGSHLVSSASMLFLVAFGIKAAVFPLFFWLPASYHTPPPAVSALFAGLLTKVGAYAVLRTFTLIFVQDIEFTRPLILMIAGFTMVSGGLGAVAQTDMRRLLSFSIVSQIGYIFMGLGISTALSLAGAVFFLFHMAVTKAALFLIAGAVPRLMGSSDLDRSGGLYRASPVFGCLFLVPALSMAGIPPLSGFWGKYMLVRAGLEIGRYGIAAVALAVGLITLFYLSRIWVDAFWRPAPEPPADARRHPGGVSMAHWLPLGVLAAVAVLMGLLAGPLFELARLAADQLLDPSGYIQAVLEESR